MNKLIKALILLFALTGLTVACRGQSAQPQADEQAVSKMPTYQTVIGKLLSHSDVIDFISNNNCASVGEFQLCKDAGMALWIDADQIVRTVYLYSGNADTFRRYKGKLPYGLSFYDPMWRVEEKLRNLGNNDELSRTKGDDMSYEGSSPDHMHYSAAYKQLGMTVIYNEPFPDEDAYFYAILVYK